MGFNWGYTPYKCSDFAYKRTNWVVATQIFFIFNPNPGEWSKFDEHIFQMGWFNHQPDKELLLFGSITLEVSYLPKMLARGKKKASPSNGDILVVEKNGDQNIYPYRRGSMGQVSVYLPTLELLLIFMV